MTIESGNESSQAFWRWRSGQLPGPAEQTVWPTGFNSSFMHGVPHSTQPLGLGPNKLVSPFGTG
jgi:hypothetical protein